MKIFKSYCTYLLMSTALVFTSCVADDEPVPIPQEPKVEETAIKPLISIDDIKGENKFKPGDTVNLNFNLSDNVDLASWRIDIISDEEEKEDSENKIWKSTLEDLTGNVSGKEVKVEKAFEIPVNANPGTYKLVIYLINKSGNETSTSLDIEIIDSSKPTIKISGLENGAKLKLNEYIKAKLEFSSGEGLASWKIKIIPAVYDEKAWKNEVSGTLSGKEVQLNETIKIPNNAKVGKYQFIVYATDKTGNEISTSLDIEIIKPSPPTIKGEFINSANVGGVTKFKPGENIIVNLIFSDDAELSSWRIKINPSISIRSSNKAWKRDISGNLSGKEAQLNETIKIPSDAKSGKYQFIVYATNKEGFETAFSKDIEILDTVKPLVTIGGVNNNSKFKPTDNIKANLNFSDDVELASWKIKINPFSSNSNWKNEVSGNLSGKEVQLNETIKIPSDAKAGKYQFIVYVKDKAGNETINNLEIEILDTVKPLISVHSNIPKSINSYYSEEIKARLQFSDDVELASWRIKINSAPGNNNGYWKSDISGNISGRVADIEKTFTVPGKISGKYQFIVYVTDKAGNENSKTWNIDVHYSEPPIQPPLPKYCNYIIEICIPW